MVCHVCFFLHQVLCVIAKASVCVPPDTDDPPIPKRRSPTISNSVHISVGTVTWHTSAPPRSFTVMKQTAGREITRAAAVSSGPGHMAAVGETHSRGRRGPHIYHEPPTPSDGTSDTQHPAATETGVSEEPRQHTHSASLYHRRNGDDLLLYLDV